MLAADPWVIRYVGIQVVGNFAERIQLQMPGLGEASEGLRAPHLPLPPIGNKRRRNYRSSGSTDSSRQAFRCNSS